MSPSLTPATRERLRIAIQKSGRLAEPARTLLAACGLSWRESRDKLFCYGESLPVDLLLVRDDDIPGLIDSGLCDLGIVGENVLEETALERSSGGETNPYVVDRRMDFGGCRLAIAIPEERAYSAPSDLGGLRIATSYPRLTKRYFAEKGIKADVVLLTGSVEIAPRLGLADAICDLVATGSTLEANRLRAVETIFKSKATLIRCDRALDPVKRHALDILLRRIDGVQLAAEAKYIMLHAPKSALDEIKKLLPGSENPTLLPLAGDDSKVALHAVCQEAVFWETMESLKRAGASSILVLPIEKMML